MSAAVSLHEKQITRKKLIRDANIIFDSFLKKNDRILPQVMDLISMGFVIQLETTWDEAKNDISIKIKDIK